VNPQTERLHYRSREIAGAALLLALAALAWAQIPDTGALLREVLDHQSRTDAIRENYTFHEIVRTEALDGNGVVKETKSEESEVFFVNGHRIIRLVKRGGVELSAREQEREQERVKKEIDGYAKGARGAERGRGGGRARIISRILAVARTSNPRRVLFRGRETLVFDFEGDPKAKAEGMDQSAAKKLAGTVWIDEADKQVSRLEVHFYDNFHIGGGLLASVQKGTSMNVDQSPLGDGLWMQTASEDHLAARVVIKNLRENVHIQDFDFKKFDIGTSEHIGTPADVK
jgi:hypothetical protein